MALIREEDITEWDAIKRVLTEAFGQADEAVIVDALRAYACLTLSLVAIENDEIIGHIAFSFVEITSNSKDKHIVGLAPMGVLPAHQRQGVGSHLVKEGVERCRKMGIDAIVVLGHPNYYAKFGFEPAHQFGLSCVYDAPPEVFRVLDLTGDTLAHISGVVRYSTAFGVVSCAFNCLTIILGKIVTEVNFYDFDVIEV